MPDCPFNPSVEPCEIEIQLMVQNAAVEEANEVFHKMQQEIHEYVRKVEILKSILQGNGIPIPELEH